jgi:hypothetical protein
LFSHDSFDIFVMHEKASLSMNNWVVLLIHL